MYSEIKLYKIPSLGKFQKQTFDLISFIRDKYCEIEHRLCSNKALYDISRVVQTSIIAIVNQSISVLLGHRLHTWPIPTNVMVGFSVLYKNHDNFC